MIKHKALYFSCIITSLFLLITACKKDIIPDDAGNGNGNSSSDFRDDFIGEYECVKISFGSGQHCASGEKTLIPDYPDSVWVDTSFVKALKSNQSASLMTIYSMACKISANGDFSEYNNQTTDPAIWGSFPKKDSIQFTLIEGPIASRDTCLFFGKSI